MTSNIGISNAYSRIKPRFTPVLSLAAILTARHPAGMEKLLRGAAPPDDDLADLIEAAFLEGQIDGETQSLAFAWLERNHCQEQ